MTVGSVCGRTVVAASGLEKAPTTEQYVAIWKNGHWSTVVTWWAVRGNRRETVGFFFLGALIVLCSTSETRLVDGGCTIRSRMALHGDPKQP